MIVITEPTLSPGLQPLGSRLKSGSVGAGRCGAGRCRKLFLGAAVREDAGHGVQEISL